MNNINETNERMKTIDRMMNWKFRDYDLHNLRVQRDLINQHWGETENFGDFSIVRVDTHYDGDKKESSYFVFDLANERIGQIGSTLTYGGTSEENTLDINVQREDEGFSVSIPETQEGFFPTSYVGKTAHYEPAMDKLLNFGNNQK